MKASQRIAKLYLNNRRQSLGHSRAIATSVMSVLNLKPDRRIAIVRVCIIGTGYFEKLFCAPQFLKISSRLKFITAFSSSFLERCSSPYLRAFS